MNGEKKIKYSKDVLSAVLSPSVTSKPEFVNALIGSVQDKKELCKVMQTLALKLPLSEQHQFLKRVNGLQVLVKVISNEKDEEIQDEDVLSLFSDKLELQAVVPKSRPRTRSQYEAVRRVWPSRFHEDKQLEDLIARRTTQFWSDEAFERHISNAHQLGMKRQNVLLIDPNSNEVLARAESDDNGVLNHAVMKLIEEHAKRNVDGTDEYLCTGKAVYLAYEPCLMCAMALVHARIKTVFFLKSTANGALESEYRLQDVDALNHSFQVFKIGF